MQTRSRYAIAVSMSVNPSTPWRTRGGGDVAGPYAFCSVFETKRRALECGGGCRFGVQWLATALESGSLLPLWGGRGTVAKRGNLTYRSPPAPKRWQATALQVAASCRTPK